MASVVPLPFLKPFWASRSLGSICSTLRRNKRAAYTLPAIERRLIPRYDPAASLGPLPLYNGSITAGFHSVGAMPVSHAKHMTLSSHWAIGRQAVRKVASI
eukprot:358031-Chlamydomonas_euryale.AAC.14